MTLTIQEYMKDVKTNPLPKTIEQIHKMCWAIYNIEPKVHNFIDFIFNGIEKPTPENVTPILQPLLKHLTYQDFMRQKLLSEKE